MPPKQRKGRVENRGFLGNQKWPVSGDHHFLSSTPWWKSIQIHPGMVGEKWQGLEIEIIFKSKKSIVSGGPDVFSFWGDLYLYIQYIYIYIMCIIHIYIYMCIQLNINLLIYECSEIQTCDNTSIIKHYLCLCWKQHNPGHLSTKMHTTLVGFGREDWQNAFLFQKPNTFPVSQTHKNIMNHRLKVENIAHLSFQKKHML